MIINALIFIWVLWVIFHLMAMLLIVPDQPSVIGNRIVIPASLSNVLTPEEIAAIRLHEIGHQKNWHVWKNFAKVCVFIRPSCEVRKQQEFEADDYTASRGFRLPLASALRKLSLDAFDLKRADRLDPK